MSQPQPLGWDRLGLNPCPALSIADIVGCGSICENQLGSWCHLYPHVKVPVRDGIFFFSSFSPWLNEKLTLAFTQSKLSHPQKTGTYVKNIGKSSILVPLLLCSFAPSLYHTVPPPFSVFYPFSILSFYSQSFCFLGGKQQDRLIHTGEWTTANKSFLANASSLFLLWSRCSSQLYLDNL